MFRPEARRSPVPGNSAQTRGEPAPTSAPTWRATRRTMRSPSRGNRVSPVSKCPVDSGSIHKRPSVLADQSKFECSVSTWISKWHAPLQSDGGTSGPSASAGVGSLPRSISFSAPIRFHRNLPDIRRLLESRAGSFAPFCRRRPSASTNPSNRSRPFACASLGKGSIPVERRERHRRAHCGKPAFLFLSANAARHPAGIRAGIGSNRR
jgi:hypothetical protein